MSLSSEDSFFNLYLQYSSGNEAPTIFHRWAITACLAAYLGRSIYFQHGHFKVHPNIYVKLIGEAGSRKTTSIKMATKLLKLAGYKKFSAKKTRQEKFLMDMEEDAIGVQDDNILEQNLFGEDEKDSMPIAEVMIPADEFNNFIGLGNTDFMSLLGEFWDYEDEIYDHKLKNSKSVYLNAPTVTILGGNTPTYLNDLFPPSIIGQGFFSRILFIFSENTGKKITWMPEPDKELQKRLVDYFHSIKNMSNGKAEITPTADKLLDKINKSWKPIIDTRFASYGNRRFTHLLKLCLVVSAAKMTTIIDEETVLYTNTLLTMAERNMSKCLGEFGKGRNSDIAHKIMTLILADTGPLTLRELWKAVYSDLERRDQIFEILANLVFANKIQEVKIEKEDGTTAGAYLPIRYHNEAIDKDTLDYSFFSEEEISGIGV